MDWGTIGLLVKDVGAPFAGMILIFLLMNKQEQRHKSEIRDTLLAHRDEVNRVRKEHEERLVRMHDRADQLLVTVLKRFNENTEAMTRLISLMDVSFRREVVGE